MSVDTAPRGPDAEAVRAQAASWLLRRRDYDVWTAEDQRAFDIWLEASLAHRIAYLRLEAVWQDADRLTVLRRRSEGWGGPVVRGFGSVLARIMALLVITAAIGAGVYFYFAPTAERTYATAIGERKIVTLADGSRIELNTDTSLRLSKDAKGRHVSLVKGEAFFEIAHDTAVPFVVEAGSYRVVDLGTQFSVRRDGGKLNVDLFEGSARFETSGKDHFKQRSIVLVPGDAVVATADSLSVSESRRTRWQIRWGGGGGSWCFIARPSPKLWPNSIATTRRKSKLSIRQSRTEPLRRHCRQTTSKHLCG